MGNETVAIEKFLAYMKQQDVYAVSRIMTYITSRLWDQLRQERDDVKAKIQTTEEVIAEYKKELGEENAKT